MKYQLVIEETNGDKPAHILHKHMTKEEVIRAFKSVARMLMYNGQAKQEAVFGPPFFFWTTDRKIRWIVIRDENDKCVLMKDYRVNSYD